jgi:hypothetical protein
MTLTLGRGGPKKRSRMLLSESSFALPRKPVRFQRNYW